MKFSSLWYLIKEGLRNLWSNRMMSLASIGVLVSCMILSGGAGLLSYNISAYMNSLEKNNVILVYLDYDIGALDAVPIGDKISQIPNVDHCELVTKDDALQQVLDSMGDDGSLFNGLLDDNPLPNAYRITLQDVSKYQSTVKLIEALEGIQKVRGESDILQKIENIRKTVVNTGLWIVILLILVSLFIIVNTIRVTMFSRRKEIAIMKAVGSTDNFIRIPFIIEGSIIGLISGVLSTLLLKYIYGNISFGIRQVIPSDLMSFSGMFFPMMLMLVIFGILFGGFGSILSIKKYLKGNDGEEDGW